MVVGTRSTWCLFFCGVFWLSWSSVSAFGQSRVVEPVKADSTGTFTLRAALFDGPGVSDSVSRFEEDLRAAGGIEVRRVSVEQIQAGSLDDLDVVIFSGGSGGGQGRGLGEAGRERVKKFVAGGGGYVGICAGAYLATSDYDWSLHLLDARVLDRRHWARGFGNVELSLPADAAKVLGVKQRMTVYYHQGPLLAPAGRSDIPDYQEWAKFETEVKKEGVPGGVMQGTTAIAAGEFGKGRVLAISPHPERTTELDHVAAAAVRWVAGERGRKKTKPGSTISEEKPPRN